jgi:hypothetical protein
LHAASQQRYVTKRQRGKFSTEKVTQHSRTLGEIGATDGVSDIATVAASDGVKEAPIMFRPWHGTLQVTLKAATLLVRDGNRDLLKASFEPHCSHPRALLTLLEGISLSQGKQLCVALCVADECLMGRCSTLFGDELWPGESQLVQFDIVKRARPKYLPSVGDGARYCKRVHHCNAHPRHAPVDIKFALCAVILQLMWNWEQPWTIDEWRNRRSQTIVASTLVPGRDAMRWTVSLQVATARE